MMKQIWKLGNDERENDEDKGVKKLGRSGKKIWINEMKKEG
jgi:hypothetical protein